MTVFTGSSGRDVLDYRTGTLTGFLTGTVADIQDSEDDIINAGDGDDLVYGGRGQDIIHGGKGNDTLDGGLNNQSGAAKYSYVYGDEGDDIITSESPYAYLFGGAGRDTITAPNFSGEVQGGAGADHLIGKGGYLGGKLSYRDSPTAVSVNLGTGATSGGDARGDVIEGFQALAGSGFGDTLTGSALDDNLSGLGGTDVIRGLAGKDGLLGGDGDDRMFGGAGDDRLVGGAGADLMNGGAGHDTVDFGFGTDSLAVTINLATNVNGGSAAGDRFVSIEEVRGSEYADDITGSRKAEKLDGSSGNDVIRGGAGNDYLIGGAGADTIYGGKGRDHFYTYESSTPGGDYYNGGQGRDEIDYSDAVVLDLMTGTGGGQAAGDTLVSIEIIITGLDDDIISGSNRAERFDTSLGNNVVRGMGGNDYFVVSSYTDTIDGGDGVDTFYWDRYMLGDAKVDLRTQTFSGYDSFATLSMSGIENFAFEAGEATIIGSGVGNRITGAEGDDVFRGMGGRDWLDGKGGHNVLVGGAGADHFVFSTLPGAGEADLVRDFEAADMIALKAKAFKAIGPVLQAGEFHVGAQAQDANDHLIWQAGKDRLWYDADGDGAGSKVLIAVIHGANVTFDDFQMI